MTHWILESSLALASALAAADPELTEKSYAATRDLVLPSEDEVAFREIPWRAALWDAVVEARDTDRPILLWAMNGHPLGCT
jgi:hypothetical protein